MLIDFTIVTNLKTGWPSCKILLILIDLQKAFETINHEIRLGKLHVIGFSEKAIARFKSYLSDRAFTVNINKKHYAL